MRKKVGQAANLKGVLIQGIGGPSFFRVYSEDKNTFVDYDILHYDMDVTIDDTEAVIYQYDDGTMAIDYSPETLGTDSLSVYDDERLVSIFDKENGFKS